MTTEQAAAPRRTLPGPKRLLPVANVRPFIANRADFLMDMARRYGEVCTYRVGLFDVYFINEPELIKKVLVTDHACFRKTFATRMGKLVLGEGLLTNEGESHRRQRRLIQPSFTPAAISAYAEDMAAQVQETADRWTDGAAVDMYVEMMHLTLGIGGRALFGAGGQDNAAMVEEALNAFFGLVDRLANPVGALLNILPLPSNARFRNARRNIDGLVYRLIEERRASGEKRNDALTRLLNAQDAEGDGGTMTDAQIRDEIVTLFLAGHETTALAMTWTWMLLAQNPDKAAALHEELDRVLAGRPPRYEDLPNLPYTRMCIAEGMRLYPPAYLIDREAKEDYELDGFVVPKGAIVFTSPYVMQRTARFFPEPERYLPERWTPEETAKRPRFSYFPFGGGPRVCIGEPFAWMEMTLILAGLAQRWAADLPPGFVPKTQPRVTLRPLGGMPMTLRRR